MSVVQLGMRYFIDPERTLVSVDANRTVSRYTPTGWVAVDCPDLVTGENEVGLAGDQCEIGGGVAAGDHLRPSTTGGMTKPL